MRSKIQYLARPFNKMDSNKLDELILNIYRMWSLSKWQETHSINWGDLYFHMWNVGQMTIEKTQLR